MFLIAEIPSWMNKFSSTLIDWGIVFVPMTVGASRCVEVACDVILILITDREILWERRLTDTGK